MRDSLAQDSSLNFFWARLDIFFPPNLFKLWVKPDVAWLGAVLTHHLKVRSRGEISLSWCFWCKPQMTKCEACGKNRGRRERKKITSSALLVPKTPVSRFSEPGQRALDQLANLLETLGVFSALSREHRSTDRPQLVPAGLPLTTGKLSGVWERTLAVSA